MNGRPERAFVFSSGISMQCIAFIACFAFATIGAQPSAIDPGSNVCVRTDLALLDLPYNSKAADHWPSMAQSRSIAASLNEIGCYGIAAAIDQLRTPFARICAISGMETALLFVSTYLPFGNTWVHEEYHRAVLANRGIDSYDGLYNFDYDINAVSVSQVTDEALTTLKAQHPEDLIRCHSAGHEAQLDLAAVLLQDGLMKNAPLIEYPALYALLSNTGYMYFCTTKEADDEITVFNRKETSEDMRDFTGWDYTAWSYDLHRPDEPYTARGVHPSGVGIDRYIRWSDLSMDEQKYLRQQTGLSLLNLVRPQLYGVAPLQTRIAAESADVTAGVQHYLTPFGCNVGLYMLAQMNNIGYTGYVNMYRNARLTLPGIDFSIIDIPFSANRVALTWSPRLAVWLQPENQRFDSRDIFFGILTCQRLTVSLDKYIGIYSELEAKTAGWVAGIEETGPAMNVRIGCILKMK
jgi:hypothetical protein